MIVKQKCYNNEKKYVQIKNQNLWYLTQFTGGSLFTCGILVTCGSLFTCGILVTCGSLFTCGILVTPGSLFTCGSLHKLLVVLCLPVVSL